MDTSENVKIVRRIYEGWLGGDPNRALTAIDPGIELYPAVETDWVGLEKVYRGHAGLLRYLQLIGEAVGDYHPEIEELLDAGEKVVTLAVESGRGKQSGAPIESRDTAHVWTLRDGKAVRLDLYWNRSAALRAAGLE